MLPVMRSALYVRPRPGEMDDLAAMAADERRSLHEQAAHLISEGLARWRARRDFLEALDSLADDDDIQAGVA